MDGSGRPLPYVDYENRTFICRDGTVLHLRPISAIILKRISTDVTGKPMPPKVTVKIAGKHTRTEDNPEDPVYLATLAEWSSNRNEKLVKYSFIHGVTEDPPREFVAEMREYMPDLSNQEAKYLWVASKVDGVISDMQLLSRSISGQTTITEDGLDEAMDSFQGDDQRDRPEGVSVTEDSGDSPVGP
jgi:hypothetical protein